ncbi:MAG: tetratricopeptide repeat protein [Bdellovibrionaceae bacterium]|nr:tetratricopeptide repeat protein [Pseudobdellovibrionaceae bacterium]
MLRQHRLKSFILALLILDFSNFGLAQTESKVETKPKLKNEETLLLRLNKEPDNLLLRKQTALEFYQNKNYKKVIELLDSYSVDLKKQDLSLLANSFKNIEDYKNESRILNLIIAAHPKDVNFLLRLGQSYVLQEKFSEAVEQYRAAIRVQPDNEKAYYGVLEIFKKQKNQYESQIIVKDMIKMFGMKPIYISELCRIYTEEAFLEESTKACNMAISKDPKNPENHANLAQSYIDKKDLKMAEKILKIASQRFKDSERIYTMAGDFYFEQKNISVASRYFSKAVLLNRNSLGAQLGMARTSFILGKFEQALMGFENACKIDNKDSLRYFKESVSKLRLDGNHLWERKYNSSLFRCI